MLPFPPPSPWTPPSSSVRTTTLIKLNFTLHACLLKSINFKTRERRRKNKAIMKYEKRIFKMLPLIFKPIPKKLNNKLNFKPPLSHIIIDIGTKTLDSLEAKNRTNTARRPAKVKLELHRRRLRVHHVHPLRTGVQDKAFI